MKNREKCRKLDKQNSKTKQLMPKKLIIYFSYLHHVTKNITRKMKKYFANSKICCIFALAFETEREFLESQMQKLVR